jgi:hypothetical protein
MDFDGFIEKLVRFLADKEERDMERYKHLGFKEHFNAGIEFRDRQHRAEVRTAVISILLTVVVMGSSFLIASGGVEHMQHLLGASGGDVHG